MKTPNVKEKIVIGKKSKDLERMIHKGFQMPGGGVEGVDGVHQTFASLVMRAKKSIDSVKSGKKPSEILKTAGKANKKDLNREVKYTYLI